jgi:hypothetical protein
MTRRRTDTQRDGYSRDEVLGAERWASAGKVTEGHAEFSFDGIDFWGRGKKIESRVLAGSQTPAQGWWHRPACNCELCQASSDVSGAAGQCIPADTGPASSWDATGLGDWQPQQSTGGAMRRRPLRSPTALSLPEVRECGLPALFLDFGEALLYLDGELFDVDERAAALRAGSRPLPLPEAILAKGVGIDYGWHHARRCACRFCSRGRRPDAKEESAA